MTRLPAREQERLGAPLQRATPPLPSRRSARVQSLLFLPPSRPPAREPRPVPRGTRSPAPAPGLVPAPGALLGRECRGLPRSLRTPQPAPRPPGLLCQPCPAHRSAAAAFSRLLQLGDGGAPLPPAAESHRPGNRMLSRGLDHSGGGARAAGRGRKGSGQRRRSGAAPGQALGSAREHGGGPARCR